MLRKNLSIRAVTGKPIKFIGTGETLDAVEPFYPDRMATRILGMGDIVSLVEKAQETLDGLENNCGMFRWMRRRWCELRPLLTP